MRPSADAIVAISEFFTVSTDWLLKGEEYRSLPLSCNKCLMQQLTEEKKQQVNLILAFLAWEESQGIEACSAATDEQHLNSLYVSAESNEKSLAYLPVLAETVLGSPIFIDKAIEGYIPVEKRFAMQRNFIVRITGDSMIGAGIEPGDFVIVRPQSVVENSEIALVRFEGKAVVNRFHRTDNTIWLESENDKYKPIFVAPSEIDVVGKVIKIIKKDLAFQR